MRNKKNQFLKYKMSYQETTKPAVSSNSYSSSSVQDMVQVNTMTTIHLINKLNTFTTPYLKSNHQPGEEEYKKLENDIKTLDEQVSQNINDIELLDQKIDNLKEDLTADKYEWFGKDVSSEYTDEYNMKRCFNKYGDSFLIRSRNTYTLDEYTIHECEVNTSYGPNIQYYFISDYVYIPSWIKDKDDDKIIYHIIECDFVMNKNTVKCSSKKFEFGEGFNRILVRYSSTLEYIKINSDCSFLGLGDNSVLKDVDISQCYQLVYCEITNSPLIKNKCFTTRSTPDQFLTNNNNTYLDITQNWFISGDGLWRGKFIAGWHYQDVEFFDRFGNGLIARITDSDNDSGFYKTVTGHDILTDYFKFPSMVTFSNDLYNDKRLVHVPRVAMNVYTDSSFTTKSMTSNARILDFSNGITGVDWTYDNLVEKIIVSPSVTSLNFIYDTALKSINLVDCDKLDSLTIQNCPNITQIVLQHRPSNLNVDNLIKTIILDEMNDSITSNTSSITTLDSSITTINSSITTISSSITTLDSRVSTLENSTSSETNNKFELRWSTNINDRVVNPVSDDVLIATIIDKEVNINWGVYISSNYTTFGYVDRITTMNSASEWKKTYLYDYTTGEKTEQTYHYNIEVPTMFFICTYYSIHGDDTTAANLIFNTPVAANLTLYNLKVAHALNWSSPGSLSMYNSTIYDLIVDNHTYPNISATDTEKFSATDNSTISIRHNIF